MPEALHTCMLCEAICGLKLEIADGHVVSVRGDSNDPFSRGHICPKAAALPDIHDDPHRVREPLRRVGDRFVPVSWDEALDEAGTRLAGLQRTHGPNSVGVYLGNPSVHSYSAVLANTLFARLLGSRARFSATSVDQLPHMLAALEMFGHQLLMPVPDIDRTQFLLVLGANPAVSNGSIMSAPGAAARLKAIHARGGRVVVVDPRRSETASLADEHLFIRPGTDAFLLLALLEALFADGRIDPARFPCFTDGLEQVRSLTARFPAERVADRVGIDARRIRQLAQAFSGASSAVCYGRVGVCTQELGGLSAWLINVLNVVTGNLDRPGGSMFTTPAADIVSLATILGLRGHFNQWQSRVRGLPEFTGELPAVAMAEELDTPGEGQVRGLVTFAGNPVLSTPNGARLDRALAGLEFMVSIDVYRNETTRHAHLILPTSFGFERDHYDLAFYFLAVRNAARWVPPALRPPEGVRHDWQVVCDLALRLHAAGGGNRQLSAVALLRGLRWFGPQRMLDFLLRVGKHRLSLSKLKAQPHGIDLGPLEPRLPALLQTATQRIQLAPPSFLQDARRLEAVLEARPLRDAQLLLIGRRGLRSNNSWMHNSERLVKGPEACTLLMNGLDAQERGLVDGQRVVICSRVGEVTAPLVVSDEVGRGVVSLPHGWGHDRSGAELPIAASRPGASINDLTDERRYDALTGTAAFSGTPVTVAPAANTPAPPRG